MPGMSAALAGRFRQSKFKHVFGKAAKREHCYENIRVTTSGSESTFCAVNPRYLAVITDAVGGGAFVVLPIGQFGRVKRDPPLVAGHKAAVLDIQWCPHNDHCIASASEDCTAKVWLIRPDSFANGGRLTQCHRELLAHDRRVSLVVWHPTARLVLLTAGADSKVLIWNTDEPSVLCEMIFPDAVLSSSFNWTGSLFACSCRDRVTRVVNARTGEILAASRLHAGSKPQQVVYLRDGRVFSTGFSRANQRQWGLWEGRSLAAIERRDIDSNNGVLFPLYDPDVDLIYLVGRGDSAIRFYELAGEPPFLHYLGAFQSSEPQRGVGCMPKRGLDTRACEIGRLYKLHQRGLCEPISFVVPRRSGQFQADLYPSTCAEAWAVGADDWLAGAEVEPALVSLRPPAASAAPAGAAAAARRQPSTDASEADTPGSCEAPAAAASPPDRCVPPGASGLAELSDAVDGLRRSVHRLAAENVALRDRLARLEAAASASASASALGGAALLAEPEDTGDDNCVPDSMAEDPAL